MTEILLSSLEARRPRCDYPCEWFDGRHVPVEHEDTEGLASPVDFAPQDDYGAVQQSRVSEVLIEATDKLTANVHSISSGYGLPSPGRYKTKTTLGESGTLLEYTTYEPLNSVAAVTRFH